MEAQGLGIHCPGRNGCRRVLRTFGAEVIEKQGVGKILCQCTFKFWRNIERNVFLVYQLGSKAFEGGEF